MPYYMGDYYGNARGDPGFGSVLGKIGGVIGAVPGVVRGIAGAIGIGARKAPLALPAAAGVATTTAIQRIAGTGASMARAAGTAIVKHPVISAAAAAGTIGALGGVGGAQMMAAGRAIRGFHISRRTGRVVRNRRMRVTNPKALRRALRRAQGFAKLAMRTIHLVHPRKKARFGGFKKRHAK